MERRWAALFLAFMCAVSLCGCREAASVGRKMFDGSVEYLVGDEAVQQLFQSMSEVNYEGMREAVEAGADVNQLAGLTAVTGTQNPLCWLLTQGEGIGHDLFGNWTNTDFAEYLLTQGADPDHADSEGRTLLMLCCEADGIGYMGAEPIFDQLLAYGANVALTDQTGKTALDYAVEHGGAYYISRLIEYGAVPTQQTLQLAFTALRNDAFLSIRALEASMIYEAWPTEMEVTGFSPLLFSAIRGEAEAVASGAASCPKEDLAMLAQLAIAFCSLDAVQAVKAAGFSFTTWKDGKTSDDGRLYYELAISTGHKDTALWLLEETGYTESDALKYAAKQGLPDMTAFFLERGALSAAMPQDLSTGFEWEIFDNLMAESAGNADVVRMLFEAGYPTNELSLAYALNQAIVLDNLDSIRYLCETAGADAAYLPDGIGSAMETACLHGKLVIVEYLLSRGASLDAEESYLAAAVMKHHGELAEYLLQHGVSPDSHTIFDDGSSDCPPLFYAVRDGRLELVKLLVDAGANVDGRDEWANGGYQPVLHCAAQNPSSRILQYLIEAGADVTAVDQDGKTAADYACTQANLDILEQAGCFPTII